jgi:hypothetical protein
MEKDSSGSKLSQDGLKLAEEVTHGLLSQILKDQLFNR